LLFPACFRKYIPLVVEAFDFPWYALGPGKKEACAYNAAASIKAGSLNTGVVLPGTKLPSVISREAGAGMIPVYTGDCATAYRNAMNDTHTSIFFIWLMD
jgi:hypothetical protein